MNKRFKRIKKFIKQVGASGLGSTPNCPKDWRGHVQDFMGFTYIEMQVVGKLICFSTTRDGKMSCYQHLTYAQKCQMPY
jgi:hypothetical protein